MKRISELRKIGIILLLFSLLFTAAVWTVDRPIGPQETAVGFAAINGAVSGGIGVHLWLYKLTQLLGVIAILVAAAFGLFGVWQWISRKSLKKVDTAILYLGGLYGVVILLYAFFEKVIVNYRPILMPGSETPEASYPSSHTMLVCVVMGSAILMIDHYVRNEKIARIAKIAAIVMIAVMVFGRLFSGVHWLTDILGGLLIGGGLLAIFASLPGVLVSKAMRADGISGHPTER